MRRIETLDFGREYVFCDHLKMGHIPKIDASHREVAPLIAKNLRLLLDGVTFRKVWTVMAWKFRVI